MNFTVEMSIIHQMEPGSCLTRVIFSLPLVEYQSTSIESLSKVADTLNQKRNKRSNATHEFLYLDCKSSNFVDSANHLEKPSHFFRILTLSNQVPIRLQLCDDDKQFFTEACRPPEHILVDTSPHGRKQVKQDKSELS